MHMHSVYAQFRHAYTIPLICVCKVHTVYEHTHTLLYIKINVPAGIDVPQENSSVQSNSLNKSLTSFFSDMMTGHTTLGSLAGSVSASHLRIFIIYCSRATSSLNIMRIPLRRVAFYQADKILLHRLFICAEWET